MSTNRFDLKAATWDDNPGRQALNQAVADAILDSLAVGPRWRVLDYGCGTASLSVMLAAHVAKVVAVDSSAEMARCAQEKVQKAGIAKVEIRQADFCIGELPAWAPFDLIVSSMCLHHVQEVARLGKAFARLLAPGGWVAIADLHLEDGSFHNDPEAIPHPGFVPRALAQELERSGLAIIGWKTIHQIPKNNREYPIFLLLLGVKQAKPERTPHA